MRFASLYIIALFLLSVSTISCATSNLDFSRDARDTFVKIKQDIKITLCNPENPAECLTKDALSTGSGAVVMRTSGGSYVLTAAHVCDYSETVAMAEQVGAKKVEVFMKAVNFKLGEYTADIINMDHTIDTCILFAHNLYTTKVAKVASATTSVEEGERVYNVAAPVGIFYEDVVPLLEGFYMGQKGMKAYYSIPAMGGSSGSPIFNADDEIVGMIHSVNVYFPVVSVSPPIKELRQFVYNSIVMGEQKRKGTQKEDTFSLSEILGISPMSAPSDLSF